VFRGPIAIAFVGLAVAFGGASTSAFAALYPLISAETQEASTPYLTTSN
jgi:hypothetical protein